MVPYFPSVIVNVSKLEIKIKTLFIRCILQI